MNRRKVRFLGKQPETLETIFNPEEGQEGTGTKKGTHPGDKESKKEATVISSWKDSEKHRSQNKNSVPNREARKAVGKG